MNGLRFIRCFLGFCGLVLVLGPGPAAAQSVADDGLGDTAPALRHCVGGQNAMPAGPVFATLNDGNLGQARRACPRNELGIAMSAGLVVDLPNFYGRLWVGGHVDGGFKISEKLEIFTDFEFLRYENLITPIASSVFSMGHLGIGASGIVLDGPVLLAVNGKVVLPTAVPLYRQGSPLGLDAAVATQGRITKHVYWHAQVGGLFSVGVSKGPKQARVGAAVTAGISLVPHHVFGFTLDARGQFGYAAGLDHVALLPGFRFSDNKRFGFELSAIVPLAGATRALAGVELRGSILMGPKTETGW